MRLLTDSKVVIFDLDGTLLNTLSDLKESLNVALTKYGYPVKTLEQVRSYVGNGIAKLIDRAVPECLGANETKLVYDTFCDYYAEHCADLTAPYEGITEVIKSLRASGKKVSIVSNKADFAVKKLAKIYFEGLIDVAVGESDTVARKPSPDMVNAILSDLKVETEDAVYVGDSEVDIATARNAGVRCVSVSWGFKDKEFLIRNGATVIADKPQDLF